MGQRRYLKIVIRRSYYFQAATTILGAVSIKAAIAIADLASFELLVLASIQAMLFVKVAAIRVAAQQRLDKLGRLS